MCAARRAWALSLVLVVGSLLAACASNDDKNSGSGASATTGATTSGTGGATSSSSAMGGASTSGASTGGASTGGAGGCGADDTPCMFGGNALCKSGSCVPCTDPEDDANCAAAYGSGNICAAGVCLIGCHDASTCGGKLCDPSSHKCAPCTQDEECLAATPYCDVSGGTCVATPPACTSGAACNGGSGWCCATTCYAGGACCNNTDCPSGTCDPTTHVCKAATCTDPPPAAKFYVDPDAPSTMSGVGSKQCPFTSLHTALTHVPSNLTAPFTVCTRGTFADTNTSSWPRYVHTYVTLDGTYCDATNTQHTIFKVPPGSTGVSFRQSGPAGMHGYDILYQGTVDDGPSGIFVTGTTSDVITIYDVTVSGFSQGILATKVTGLDPANVGIHHAFNATGNNAGMDVRDGAKVNINVTALTTSRARFSQNMHDGIDVSKATLSVEGAQYTGTGAGPLSRTVIADDNGEGGLAILGPSQVTLSFFSASSNATSSNLPAIYIVGDSQGSPSVQARNCVVNKNAASGIRNIGNDLSKVDLGTSATGTNAGNNYIVNSGGAGICLYQNPTGQMSAKGNIFSSNASKDCTASPTAKLTHASSCDSAVDIGYAIAPSQNILVNSCQLQ